jgi:preprotein translocase subunit SecF
MMADLTDDIIALLESADESVEIRRADFVGPQLGDELVEKGGFCVVPEAGGGMLVVVPDLVLSELRLVRLAR